eukprot:TRINITY_DN5478_c0_g1_i1.p1 TRINITY_DN5478_c0_g1~~TRINITY_DN5478_c0_g1_i1.p1  ORF type:complete len:428 (+),score=197.77 TRINITY_DN5478_c0_g1_i1:90-1286(+)
MATFQKSTMERSELNQYWFSKATGDAFVAEVLAQSSKGAAFISTPSLYFSLPEGELRSKCKVLEFDRQWEKDPGFVFYDYRKPEEVPIALFGAFDYIVIDPPFITEECWKAYAATARLLLAEGGKLLCTTIAENAPFMKGLLGVERVEFRPSIPSLVYQYETFTNYHPTAHLDTVNTEVPAAGCLSDALARAERESHDDFVKQMQDRDRSKEEPLAPSLAEKAKWDRVPEGLTEYPDGGAAPPPADTREESPEYTRLSALRDSVGECRRIIDQACKPLDRLWKTCVTQRKAAKEGDEAKAAKAVEENAAARAELSRLLAELGARAQSFGASDREAEVRAICEAAAAEMDRSEITKQVYMELMPSIQQKYLSPLFNQQKGLLAEMKAARKLATAAPAAP